MRVKVSSPDVPKRRPNMKQIAIVPRPKHDIGVELHDSFTCLRKVEIDVRNAVIGKACAIIWVGDEYISIAVEELRNAGFQATALAETDMPR